MKVVLIRPTSGEKPGTTLPEVLNRARGILPPLGLAYIAAILEETGHVVSIIDAEALGLDEETLKKAIYKERPEITGIYCTTLTFRGALKTAELVKEYGSIVVLGGPHLSAYPRECVQYDCIDFGIEGDGEYSFLELVDCLEKHMNPYHICGLVYKKQEKTFINPSHIIEDIDALPFPAYHLLPMKKYYSLTSDYPLATMITTRGCPYDCGFCFKTPSRKRYRKRNPKKVADEMEYLIKEYRVREIMFYDDTIALDRNHILHLCEEILHRGIRIKWESPIRVDNIDDGLISIMKRAGCRRLRFGVESGDPDILRLMNKKIQLNKVKEAFEITKKAGIETFAYFMIGYYKETLESVAKTVRFAFNLNPDYIMITKPIPYPNTDLFIQAVEEKLIEENYWELFTKGEKVKPIPSFIQDSDLLIARAYRKFYLRPFFIYNKIKMITSWPRFCNYLIGLKLILSIYYGLKTKKGK